MSDMRAAGFLFQSRPKVYVCSLPGNWLLQRTTPVWRIQDPERGFQRTVREVRARKIAVAVLDQGRAFPNAIVLATDRTDFEAAAGKVNIPSRIKFLVVDGQHRLWAQKFSKNVEQYACIVHMGLSEQEMAKLFLEINDNQKRVPSSLRWDLVRLVRPEDDAYSVATSDLIYELATDRKSPLFQLVDLTGERSEISLKQGSLAPEIKALLKNKNLPLFEADGEIVEDVLIGYFSAVKSLDPDKWRKGTSPLSENRVVRALLRLLGDILAKEGSAQTANAPLFKRYLDRIDLRSIAKEKIKAEQGHAGIKEIYDTIRKRVIGTSR